MKPDSPRRANTGRLNSAEARRHRAALVLMAASGFAGLGYQIVWTQQSALWLGHEAAAVLAVVTAFFGGLALGALVLGRPIERAQRPVLWYAACEAAIGLWGLALIPLMRPFSDGILALTGVQPNPAWQWTVAFGGTFVLLLPATAAMGATLPAMERIFSGMRAEGRSIAAYYAANTLGAMLGVLGTQFRLVPELGLARTTALCAALNLLCAGLALAVLRSASPARQRPTIPAAPGGRRTLALLAGAGFLGIGYEVLVVRVLSQVSENTVYTFALLLAVYLAGTALGAAAYQHWQRRDGHLPRLGDMLPAALALACLFGIASLWAAENITRLLAGKGSNPLVAALWAEALPAVLAFGVPTFGMGALFSHLSARASASGIGFGWSLGANTLGAAVAPPVFGVVAAPVLGSKLALLSVAAGYLLLTSRRGWKSPAVWAPAGLAFALAGFGPPLRFVEVPGGGHLVSYREGALGAVSVVEDAEGVARLRINNRQQEGSSSTLTVDARQALLPVLLHPSPRRALFLGLGTGITAASAAEDPNLDVDAVELLPEVIEASRHFTREFADGQPNPRLHLIAADARRYVRVGTDSYDVIVADNVHPARSGSGALYTVEHFQAVRERLAPRGLFCQWLPLHQLDLETLRSIVRSFIAAYPGGWAMLASNSMETPVIGLVGREGGARFDVAETRQRLASAAFPERPANFGIEDEFALLGSFLAGPKALASFAASGTLNTDDRPVVAYLAPRAAYAPEMLPRDRLIALVHEVAIEPEEAVQDAGDPVRARRLAAYWRARNGYLEAGRGVRPSASVEAMLAQVREPLLAVLRESPDFRPAYDPLLRMAVHLGRKDATSARALLQELEAIQPDRPEAGLALNRLGAAPP